MTRQHVNDLWFDAMRLRTAATVPSQYADMDRKFAMDAAAFVGYNTFTLNDAWTAIAKYVSTLDARVPPVMPWGRISYAGFQDADIGARMLANGNRNDLWYEWLLRGGGKTFSWANLSTDLNIRTPAGAVVAGTYTRTDANGLVYFDDGSGVLRTAVNNTPYRHGVYGMYFEVPSKNLLLHAIDLWDAYWTKSNATGLQTSAVKGPDGVSDSLLLTDSVDVGPVVHSLQRAGIAKTSAIATVLTLSFFVRSSSLSSIQLRINESGNTANRVDAIFSLTGGGMVTSAAAVAGTFTLPSARVDMRANGWVRVQVTCTSGTEAQVQASAFLVKNGTATYQGDGTGSVHIWGGQLEELNGIATTLMASVTAQATRSSPSLSWPITAYDIVPAPTLDYSVVADIFDIRVRQTIGLNGHVFKIIGETDRLIRKMNATLDYVGRFGTANAQGAVPELTPVRLRQSVKIGTANKLSVNGRVVATQASTPAVAGVGTSLRVGSSAAGADIFHGFIKRFSFLNEATIA